MATTENNIVCIIHRTIKSAPQRHYQLFTVTKVIFDLNKYKNVNFDRFWNIICAADIHHLREFDMQNLTTIDQSRY